MYIGVYINDVLVVFFCNIPLVWNYDLEPYDLEHLDIY